MKTTALATTVLALGSIFASAAMAKEVTEIGCTKDGHTATLKVDVRGSVWKPGVPSIRSLEDLMQEVFTKIAASLHDADLINPSGGLYHSTASDITRAALKDQQLSNDAYFRAIDTASTISGAVCTVN